MRTTNIKIDQFGNIKIEQTGFVGTACAEVTQQLMAGLSSKSEKEDKKPEFFQSAPQKQQASSKW